MGLSGKRLKNDPDRRMGMLVAGTHVFLPEKDIQALTRSNLDHWISELRQGETEVRQLRKRLEALRDQSARSCPVCGRPVTGRPDAIYCEATCRIRAHRQAQRERND
jgi:DNA repair exonuclease SbcCD ATPase subunit